MPKSGKWQLNCVSFFQHIHVYLLSGRFDVNRYVLNCNECLMEYDPFNLETILYSDLWPGSVNNLHYLFHQDVFRLWDAFRKRMPGSSEVGFINALCDLSTLNQRVSVFL